MRRIIIDCSEMKTVTDAHMHLARELAFPEYYGANLDALHDCLGELSEETHVMLLNSADLENVLGMYGLLILQVLEQSARENDFLTVSFFNSESDANGFHI